MLFKESFGIVDNEGEIAAAASTSHLPGEGFIFIDIYIFLYAGLHHAWEHGDLGIEGGLVGLGEGCQVLPHDGYPAGIGG